MLRLRKATSLACPPQAVEVVSFIRRPGGIEVDAHGLGRKPNYLGVGEIGGEPREGASLRQLVRYRAILRTTRAGRLGDFMGAIAVQA